MKLGVLDIDKIMLGAVQADKIMLGVNEVYPIGLSSLCDLTPILNWKLQGNMTDNCGSNDGTGSPSYIMDNGIQVWDGAAGSVDDVNFDIGTITNNGVTLAGWVKVGTYENGRQDAICIMNGAAPLATLRVDGSDILYATGNKTEIIGTQANFEDKWKYVILTSTQTEQTANINGIDISVANNATGSSYINVIIGAAQSNGAYEFKGRISDAMFFNRVLTEDEKADLWDFVRNDLPLT